MRKITKQIADAFYKQRRLAISNTRTDGQCVWLHGNKIIERQKDGTIWFTLAGWNTVTTRERLNGILAHYNKVHIMQRRGQAVLIANNSSKYIKDCEWINVSHL